MKKQSALEKRIRREMVVNVYAEPEYCRIDGNCSAIDPETDEKTAAWIREQLDSGNEWAWATVTVTVEWCGLKGRDSLGCCSYASKKDFCQPDGYYPDMVNAALEQVLAQAEKILA